MVSLQQLQRLSDQVGEIERLASKKPFKVVFITYALPFTQNEITARHHKIFPEDRDPDACFLTVYAPKLSENPVLPVETENNRRCTAAWRSLVRERGMAA